MLKHNVVICLGMTILKLRELHRMVLLMISCFIVIKMWFCCLKRKTNLVDVEQKIYDKKKCLTKKRRK